MGKYRVVNTLVIVHTNTLSVLTQRKKLASEYAYHKNEYEMCTHKLKQAVEETRSKIWVCV